MTSNLEAQEVFRAYYHILIHHNSQKLLRFAIKDQHGNTCHFQFTALPFGISSAPRIFTKLVMEMVAFLRQKELNLMPYLDYFLLVEDTVDQLLTDLDTFLSTLRGAGLDWQSSEILSTSIDQSTVPGCLPGLAVTGHLPAHRQDSGFGGGKANSLDPEGEILRHQRLSDKVIVTLWASGKKVTSAIYLKIWKRFCSWSGESFPNLVRPKIQQIDFLQQGIGLGLKPSTLKVQVSALSCFFDADLTGPQVDQKIHESGRKTETHTKITSSFLDPLILFLNALTMSPFEPLEDCSNFYLLRQPFWLR